MNGIGQRTAVETTGSAFSLLGGGNRGWTWSYDALGQLTVANHASTTDFNRGYTYDTIGNRFQAVESTEITGYAVNILNQYSEIGRSGPQSWYPQYDDDGNQLSGALDQAAGKTFEWDGKNRLIAIRDANGELLVTYAYDHASRRIQRTMANGGFTLFVYDGWNLVAEYVRTGSETTLSRTHTWGLDLSGSLQGAGGVGGLLVSETPSGTPIYAAYDGNGNVTVLVGADGTVTGVYEYDPYGNVLGARRVARGSFTPRLSRNRT